MRRTMMARLGAPIEDGVGALVDLEEPGKVVVLDDERGGGLSLPAGQLPTRATKGGATLRSQSHACSLTTGKLNVRLGLPAAR